MSHLPLLEADEAPENIRELYFDFQRRMGFPAPPNFIKIQGHSAAAAAGTWGLVQNVLVGGSLPRTLKEMLFTAISAERKCRYCEAAHLACCHMLGVDPQTLEQMARNVHELEPPKVRDMLRFGLKCARDPQSLVPADFEGLRQHGLRTSEIMELISMSALAVYANIVADATGVPADEMFGQI